MSPPGSFILVDMRALKLLFSLTLTALTACQTQAPRDSIETCEAETSRLPATAPACVDVFTPRNSIGSPSERLASKLLPARIALSITLDRHDLVDRLASESVRAGLLQAQALAKAYERATSGKTAREFETHRRHVKDLDGAIGGYMRFVELVERTANTSLSPVAKAHLGDLRAKARRDLIRFLEKENWLDDPARNIERLVRGLTRARIDDPAVDRVLLIRGLRDLAKETRRELNNYGSALRVADLVTALGTLKDFKETELDLAVALHDSGLIARRSVAHDRAHAILVERFGAIAIEETSQSCIEPIFKKTHSRSSSTISMRHSSATETRARKVSPIIATYNRD